VDKMNWLDLILGFSFSILIALLALWKKSLSKSGFFTSIFVGGGLYYFGGWSLWLGLMLFFATSTIFTKYHESEKKNLLPKTEKAGPRDMWQVLANGFTPLFWSFLFFLSQQPLFLVMAFVAIASSNSDTWASEMGMLTKGKTVSILTLRPMDKGSSGGVSAKGILFSFLGSSLIGLFFGIISLGNVFFELTEVKYGILIAVFGFLGSVIDSILGATVQAKFNGNDSEFSKNHPTLIRGWRWMTNDMVNFLSALISSGLFLLFIL